MLTLYLCHKKNPNNKNPRHEAYDESSFCAWAHKGWVVVLSPWRLTVQCIWMEPSACYGPR